MIRERGVTLIEVVVMLAVVSTLAGIAVPSVAALRSALLDDAAARTLALVLRAAQARAQARATLVRVTVESDGTYAVAESASATEPEARERRVLAGRLGVAVTSNYPGGAVRFGPRGRPYALGSASPRAGTFLVGDSHRVVLQLGGCVRCL